MTCLESLNLSFNWIAKIEHLDRLKHLRELNLAENNIRKLENLDSLVNLQKLNLSGNNIAHLSSGLSNLTQLSVLRIARNKLAVLSEVDKLALLSNLSSISVHGNPMADLEQAKSYIVYKLPMLTIYDGDAINDEDRTQANKRFHSATLDGLNAEMHQVM